MDIARRSLLRAGAPALPAAQGYGFILGAIKGAQHRANGRS